MPHFFFQWSDDIVEYIAQHGVDQDEFEEVVLNATRIKQSRSSDRSIVFGPTSTGKFLACVFEYMSDYTVIPVTAYEVDDE